MKTHQELFILVVLIFSHSCGRETKLESMTKPIISIDYRAITNRLGSLNFPQSDCLQIIVDDDAMIDSNPVVDSAPYIVRSLLNLLDQNIHDYDFAERRSIMNYYQCNLFFVHPKSQSSLEKLFVRSNKMMFYPHTVLVVIGLEIPKWNISLAKFIRENALCLLFLDEASNQLYSMTRHGMNLENEYVAHRSDPSVGKLLDNDKKDVLQISLYEHIPYVINDSEAGYIFMHLYISKYSKFFILFQHRIDGVEFRIVSELAKYWNLRFVSNLSSSVVWNPSLMFQMLDTNIDLALCSPWLIIKNYKSFGLSTYIDSQCGTLLVRSPAMISSSLYIYYALSFKVWILIIICLFFTAVVLTAVSRYEGTTLSRWKTIDKKLIYEDFARSIMDLTSITSGESIHILSNYSSIRILLIRLYICNDY